MSTNASLLKGSIRDFGLVEILQMMGLGGMTGALHLKQSTGHVGVIYVTDGKVASCSELESGALTLGDVLQQLGMATHTQIEETFSQQLQDVFGKPIGERLVERGVISPDQLREALRTKVLWTLRELGLWKEGTYEFIAAPYGQSILPYGESSLDMEVMRITLEMVRYSDEWEQLHPYLPQGVRTTLQMAPNIPYALLADIRMYELLMFVNHYRSVRRIASAMRRPELEVARDLARLVQQGLLLHVFQQVMPQSPGRGVRLPDPAERTRMESFELLNLIERMEQEWLHRRTPVEQLPALVEFVNWTMDALTDTCREKGIDLDWNTLHTTLARGNLLYMGNYDFKIVQNHIDVENFASLCHEVLNGNIQKARDFYDEASDVLQRILRCVFEMINSRVASLDERLENQEVWEAMFSQFALQRQ
jgi:predicted transcriptional regulator